MEFNTFAEANEYVQSQEQPDNFQIDQVPFGNRVKWQVRDVHRFAE